MNILEFVIQKTIFKFKDRFDLMVQAKRERLPYSSDAYVTKEAYNMGSPGYWRSVVAKSKELAEYDRK